MKICKEFNARDEEIAVEYSNFARGGSRDSGRTLITLEMVDDFETYLEDKYEKVPKSKKNSTNNDDNNESENSESESSKNSKVWYT